MRAYIDKTEKKRKFSIDKESEKKGKFKEPLKKTIKNPNPKAGLGFFKEKKSANTARLSSNGASFEFFYPKTFQPPK